MTDDGQISDAGENMGRRKKCVVKDNRPVDTVDAGIEKTMEEKMHRRDMASGRSTTRKWR